ncbi:MAG: hypothetical protein WBC18_17715 [Ottowia sp.]|uniref:hypothetical protein n=1 Tax=Ottowia sp. TaxID=1898956 RepID=UPI003C775097
MSAFDDLSEAILKAKAISYMTYGESGEVFRNMNDTAQDEYLWALSGLIVAASEALKRLENEGRKGGAA